MLNGEVGQSLKVVVKISPVSEELFGITQAKADQGKDIRVSLTGGKETGGTVYFLTIENTKGTSGRYHDLIRLLTTSKVQQEIVIPVWGNLRLPEIASFEPRHVVLNGTAGETIEREVRIVPKNNQTFSITEVRAQSGSCIEWELNKGEESGKRIYTLTVKNVRKEKGRYSDTLFLKTDHPGLPEMRIGISGRITE